MPPVVPRKRLRPDSPEPEPPPKSAARPNPRRTKVAAFDTPPTTARTLSQKQRLLDQLINDDSELSEPGSSGDEFEDVSITGNKAQGKQKAQSEDSESSEDEEWEDALGAKHHTKHDDEPVPVISGDLELTLDAPSQVVFFKPDGKKGPSKIERQIRNVTHCMHVQFLMFHNLIRNAWVSDKDVQRILVGSLTVGCWKEVHRYWRDAGISDGPKRVVKGGWTEKVAHNIEKAGTWKASGKKGVQVFDSPVKPKGAKAKAGSRSGPSEDKADEKRKSDRNQRDWGATSDRLEPNTPNLSAGEPLLRLLKYLSAYWRGRFKITAPCLRKRGYLSPSTLEAETQAWREHPSDAHAFGERVENLDAFRELAGRCEGSKDVGQQLFTALLRGLGIEARMVASLQPVGFGWSQGEEGKSKDLSDLKSNEKLVQTNDTMSTPKKSGKARANGTKQTPIDLSDSGLSDLSSAISVSSDSEAGKKTAKSSPKGRKYGDELPHPTYWTEAISSLTHTPIAVSVLPRTVIAAPSIPEQISSFYCRGAAADKAKQVFAYLIAFSSDGSAKDVTTRYLPRHQWPGRTKRFRMPVEKIPIHNKRGKVKRWEEWNWFKSVLRPYARPIENRQPWDEVEDEGDLVPAEPAKPKDMDEEGGKETLQGYKNSAEYVLERHLRREEAIKPGAKIVRHFVTGKGDNEKEEPVYRRKDIVTCKSVESWHKEGRAIKEGEQPLKYVPTRAVTVQRKREIEEREREEGEKVKQGLYSEAQTDWIIPDPIVDAKIPRNAFGNIDVYVPTMIPRGAVHVPLKGTARLCRKLNIDYAEACTGFEFGKQRAVPVLTGVVVAAENENLLIDAWGADQAEKEKKEHDKREKLILGLWKKFFVGLRVVERMNREYGDVDVLEKETRKPAQATNQSEGEAFQHHSGFEGGFVHEEPGAAGGFLRGDNEDEDMAGGFLVSSQGDAQVGRSSFTVDHGDVEELEPSHSAVENAYQTPVSLHSLHQKPAIEAEDEERPEDNGVEKAPDEDAPVPPPSRRTRGTAPPGRPRGPSRGSQRPPTCTRKAIPVNDDEEQSSLSNRPSDSPPLEEKIPEDESDVFTPAHRGKRKASAASPVGSRSVPKRRAARKSGAQVKSHFFAHGSEEETDASPQKGSSLKGRGRGGARGRGRGRARGSARDT